MPSVFCVFLLGSQRDHYGFRPRVSLSFHLSIYSASGEWGGECGPRTRRETTIRFHVRRRRARRTQVHARCRTLLLALQPPTLLTPRRICMSYVSTHLFSVYSPREARASASSVRESSMLRMGGIINYSFAGSDFELGRGTLYLFSFRRGESKRPATSVLANSVLYGFTALYRRGSHDQASGHLESAHRAGALPRGVGRTPPHTTKSIM